ncbi:hypothetical protein C8R46DRAFT_1093633 [Mycena filopes]|nr:hypothetical protein C8R46DRAFT_1093633 [Mycena filopes]
MVEFFVSEHTATCHRLCSPPRPRPTLAPLPCLFRAPCVPLHASFSLTLGCSWVSFLTDPRWPLRTGLAVPALRFDTDLTTTRVATPTHTPNTHISSTSHFRSRKARDGAKHPSHVPGGIDFDSLLFPSLSGDVTRSPTLGDVQLQVSGNFEFIGSWNRASRIAATHVCICEGTCLLHMLPSCRHIWACLFRFPIAVIGAHAGRPHLNSCLYIGWGSSITHRCRSFL